MLDTLTSRQRVLRTLRGEPVDRIPIFAPIPWSPRQTDPDNPPQPWMRNPEFQAVVPLVDEHCDAFVGCPVFPRLFDRQYLEIPRRFIEALPEERRGDRWTVNRTIVHTPGGDLHTTVEAENGISTSWYPEPLVKTTDDARKLLSVPFDFDPPDVGPFFEHTRNTGEAGLVQTGVSSPVVCVSRLLHFDQFLEWCAAERELILELERTVHERIMVKLRHLVASGVAKDTVLWIGGSEQCTPPMMGPRDYDAFVLPFEGEIYRLWHEGGGFVHLHCHGKVGTMFDRMVEMGADCIDPMEPPPDGDLTLADARARAAGRTTLMGNIEFHRLEYASPSEIDELVHRAIDEGGPDHFMLYPSATAIQAITPQQSANCIRYIEAGVRYGRLS